MGPLDFLAAPVGLCRRAAFLQDRKRPSSASLSEQSWEASNVQRLVSDGFKLFMIHCVPFFFKPSFISDACTFPFLAKPARSKTPSSFSKAEVSILCPRGYAIDSPKTLQCTGRPSVSTEDNDAPEIGVVHVESRIANRRANRPLSSP